MAWARVQSKNANSGSSGVSSQSVTLTTTPTTGNKIILHSASSSGASSPTYTAADSSSNTITKLDSLRQANGSNSSTESLFAYDVPATASATFTVSATGSSPIAVLAQEISGLLAGNTTAMLDGSVASSSGTTTTWTAPTYSSTASGEYLITTYGDDGAPATATAQSGWTIDTNSLNNNGNDDCIIVYKSSTGGSENAAISLSGSPPNWVSFMVAFKLAAGAPAAYYPFSQHNTVPVRRAANW